MIVTMDAASASSSREIAQRLFDKNFELENRRRKSAQARVPSDPNAWQQMRENYEAIILEDHYFSEQHNIEYALWQLHYRRIEEFRAHFSAASASAISNTSQTARGVPRPDRVSKIRLQFKAFLSEATGFYHDLILKIKSKYGLPFGHFSDDSENMITKERDGNRSLEIKKGLVSCHRCLIYLGDLARYKGLYGEGDSKSRDYAAASSYYLQASSLCPSSGNPHHQLAILATYSGDELMAVYRYFRSLTVDNPFLTARDNLIVAFEKNRQSFAHLHGESKVSDAEPSRVQESGTRRGRGEPTGQLKEVDIDTSSAVERASDDQEVFKALCVRFVRLSGILFTRTSLETFTEVLSLVNSGLLKLLSSGPEEKLSFGPDAVDNGLFIVRLVSILIFTVNSVKGESESQSYADVVQRIVLLQNALLAVFELMGLLLRRCLQYSDPSSSYFLPGILVFVEWMASSPDVAVQSDTDDKQSSARSNFWKYCVLFLNKLLSVGLVTLDDEDETCFSSNIKYEEGDTENRLALWEDFELRGFLPLQPAHAVLDFSRKHSLGGDQYKEKIARIKRILAAGKALANAVPVDQKPVRFDLKLKKFFMGNEPQRPFFSIDHSASPESNGDIKVIMKGSSENITNVQPVAMNVEGEDEDEVIVFKPTLIDKGADMVSSKWAYQDGLAPVRIATGEDSLIYGGPILDPHANLHKQNESNATNVTIHHVQKPNLLNVDMHSITSDPSITPHHMQASTWLVNQQSSLVDGLNGLSLFENGPVLKPGLHKDVEVPYPAFSVPFQQSIGVALSSKTYSETKATGSVASPMIGASAPFGGTVSPFKTEIVAPVGVSSVGSLVQKVSSSVPESVVKNSSNRPVRHIGPPPGFNSVRPKQIIEPVARSAQNPLMDNYSWLDGYQLKSSLNGSGYIQPINQPLNVGSQYIGNGNGSMGRTSLPFPGKQNPPMLFDEDKQKTWQDQHILESLESYREQLQQQQQYVPFPDQQKGDSIWSGNRFV